MQEADSGNENPSEEITPSQPDAPEEMASGHPVEGVGADDSPATDDADRDAAAAPQDTPGTDSADAPPLVAPAPGDDPAPGETAPDDPATVSAGPDAEQPTQETGTADETTQPPDLSGDARADDAEAHPLPRDNEGGDRPGADPSPVLAPVPVEQPRIARGPGFFTLLFGGLIAGAIGYGLAEYDVLPRAGEDPLVQLESRLDDQSGRLDALGAQAAAAEEAATAAAAAAENAASAAATMPDDLQSLRDQIASMSPGASSDGDPGLAARMSDIEARLDTLASDLGNLPRDGFATADSLDALEQQIADLRGTVETQQAAIDDATAAADAARSSAADETRRITVQGALARIAAALENGDPFVDSVSDLQTAGGVDVPAPLRDVADRGVSPLSALQADFPAAARAALSVSIREESGGGLMDRLGAFLRAQTGARSLDAREGSDPDAILSRAQTAVRNGNLGVALDEIAALPEGGQAEMAGWVERARSREAAVAAHGDLTASLNSN